MALYQFSVPGVDLGRLEAEIRSAGLPILSIAGGEVGSPDVFATMFRPLTFAEENELNDIVAAHDGRRRRPRIVYAIYRDLTNLTSGQQSAVWADLSGGVPPKWALDAGPNAAAIAAIEFSATVPSGISAAEKTQARLRLAAMYVQDNPRYLVGPAFAPAINVPGDEPVA